MILERHPLASLRSLATLSTLEKPGDLCTRDNRNSPGIIVAIDFEKVPYDIRYAWVLWSSDWKHPFEHVADTIIKLHRVKSLDDEVVAWKHRVKTF